MLIDIHVHVAGTGSHSGCFMSEKLRRSPSYILMLLTTGQIFGEVNDLTIRRHLMGTLRASRLVSRAVFLALDAIPREDGTPDRERTHLHVPNDYVREIAKEEDCVLFGASVHPDRPDALDELDRVVAEGAVLNKWIPSSQAIDLEKPGYLPFYEKLRDLSLPLLCHVGAEHAVPCPDPENAFRPLDDPARLRPVLRSGATVIAAHCAMPVFSWDQQYMESFLDMMREAKEEEWNLYADVSALAGPFPHRVGLLGRLVKELPHDRLLFGSDYPVPVTSLWPGAAGEIDLHEWADATLTRNPFDKNVKMIRALGFDECVLTNAEKVLRLSGPATG